MNSGVLAPRLNAICPYFTMFPIEFPMSALSSNEGTGTVLDPFSGRGTTAMAARVLGRGSISIDSARVAAAVTESKMTSVTPDMVVDEAQKILHGDRGTQVPDGEFWRWAFSGRTLEQLCAMRNALLTECGSASRKALRGLLLGALHGPITKSPSYLSNQCPRTYAPKPKYAVQYWRSRGLTPPEVDIISVVQKRASWYFAESLPETVSQVVLGDSRDPDTWARLSVGRSITAIVTSPPYLSMQTYVPDQWLRDWFLGGPSTVNYTTAGQVRHSSECSFADDLRRVWQNSSRICAPGCRLHIRFGGIPSRPVDPSALIAQSTAGTSWEFVSVLRVDPSPRARRQVTSFASSPNAPLDEFDFEYVLNG